MSWIVSILTTKIGGRMIWAWLTLGVVLVSVWLAVRYLGGGSEVSKTVRLILTLVFLIGTVVIAVLNDVFGVLPPIDEQPFDYYTLAHFAAGLAFGAWYTPFWLVFVVTVGWEVYEAKVPGFGDKEILVNRFVDVGVALIGWLIVTGWASHGNPPVFCANGNPPLWCAP